MNRQILLNEIKNFYRQDRLNIVDRDYLLFEEEITSLEDLERILLCCKKKIPLPNPHNSCLLYCTELSSQFDFTKERCDTQGGSPPDIDIDFEALGRDKAVELVAQEWGRDNVANIITHGTLKPKSLTRKYFKLSTPVDYNAQIAHTALMHEILDKIPEPLFGKEATLKEIIEGNPEKGYSPHPELLLPKYEDWYKFAFSLEEMIANFGIHAAGVVISEFPIYEQIPVWSNSKAERITQYDMKEVETLGLIKFDFLSINNLDIIKECVSLIEKHHNKKYNIYDVPDGNKKAYDLLNSGFVQGIFQMETSKTAKELILEIKPQSISDLSDISALNRPGPLQYAHEYITNKKAGKAPQGLPSTIAEIIKDTNWILLYQEQVMRICTDIAGYTLREADDIRRAMGKKKVEILIPYKESFIKGCVKSGIDKEYATTYWDKTLIPFADYSFNKSHSVAYSFITYLCAYFKANYPSEFFCALMSVRSRVMQPLLWAEKAPEYIQEAKSLGIQIHSPSVQTSVAGFTLVDSDIYFGFNGIRDLGSTAAKAIVAARAAGKFIDIWDFLARVDQRIINSKVLEALIIAGAFDSMGYCRKELKENLQALVSYLPNLQEYLEHTNTREIREIENARIDSLREELDLKIKSAKKIAKECQKNKTPVPEEISQLINLKETFEIIADNYESTTQSLRDLYDKYGNLRKLPNLKPKEKPIQPIFTRNSKISINIEQLMEQAEYLGCYLSKHPAKIVFPNTTSINSLTEGEIEQIAGQIIGLKVVRTKKREEMAFIQLNDGTGSAEVIVFPKLYATMSAKKSLPEINDIVKISGKVEAIEPIVKIVANNFLIHKRKNENI